jgi:hypothetical protein
LLPVSRHEISTFSCRWAKTLASEWLPGEPIPAHHVQSKSFFALPPGGEALVC